MTLYVDSSALLKRYVDEPDSELAESIIRSDPTLVTSRLTEVEVRRNLGRLLSGDDLHRQRAAFQEDLGRFAIVALDHTVLSSAASLAEQTLCRSFDAIHLAAAKRVGRGTMVVTFDRRQADAARTLGLTVRGE